MTSSIIRRALAALALCVLMAAPFGGPALAQGSVNPTASSVKEQQLLEALKPDQQIKGRITIPDRNASSLIQPEGRDFRSDRDANARIGGLAILGTLALLVGFYLVRGKVRISGGASGRTITRFGSVDRFAHWLTATSFLALGLTGLNITFGRSLLLPLIGGSAFTSLSQAGKFVHNYVSFAFVLGIVLMFVLWVKDNFPALRDIRWFVQGGGLIGLGHPPADRFNGGQKLIFWSVILGGAAISVTGYMLMFPFVWTDIAGMQWANVWHGLIGAILFAIILAHIYIGSVGMEGAFDAMGSGEVDLNWAKEHHSIWTDRVLQRGGGKAAPAE
jgi:formate dehydrogenase subunit gamma